MAITGISAISGEQIIAAGAVSAKEAGKASFTTGGNDIQNLYDTVSTNSASWAGGADYSAGKNISIAGDVISTTDTISVTGDVQVENSTETQVTSVAGTEWGTNYYGHYASLNSSYKITVSGTPANLGVYVYDYDHGGYYVNGLTTADLQNFTISGLSSLPNAVTSKIGDWSTTDWFEGAEFGIQDPTYNPGYDPGMPAWTVSSTLYSLAGSNISLSGLNNFVSTNSASWTGGGASYTGDAQGALDEVYSKSANWDGSYDTLTANSAAWTSTNNTVSQRSGNWNKAYTAVTGNSAAWGGSALPISAGPGVKMDIVNDTLVFSNDETVLWSGTAQSGIQLNEPITNFGRIGVLFGRASNSEIKFFDTTRSSEGLPLQIGASFSNGYASTYTQTWVFTDSTTLTTGQKAKEWWGNTAGVSSRDTTDMPIYKVIGINRTASN